MTPAPDTAQDTIAWQALLAEFDAALALLERIEADLRAARAALAARLATAEGGE